jgi:hypothetical protein
MGQRLGWTLLGLIDARRYWWGGRLEVMAEREAQKLLQRQAKEHNLSHVANVRCPLCNGEITAALTVTDAGELAIRPDSACHRCDFRLDACRHCRHFLPAGARSGPGFIGSPGRDFTHGRCNRYRGWQPVREVYPHMAQRLEAMGYESLRAPKRIRDSFFPLEGCTAFALALKRLRRSEVSWLTRQRSALVRLDRRIPR